MKSIKYIAVSGILGLSTFVGVALAQTTISPAYPVYPSQGYCPTITSYLYQGSYDYQTGGQVSQLQYFLGTYFAAEPVPVTGYFGPITKSFVARFQQANGVYPVTGGVGPLTRAAIQRTCGGTVFPPPPTGAIFSATPTSGPSPLNVTFSVNTPNASAGSFYIDFGDGQRGTPNQIYCFAAPCSTALTAQHAYTQTGTFVARLYQDNNYCPQGMYCTLMYREPTLIGSVTINVNGTSGCPWWNPYCTNQQQNYISVTSPTSGQTYVRGGDMLISWSGSANQNASTMVDLYTAGGAKVGTIAIQSGATGSYTWNIPPFPNTRFCTQQYPNGLCGANISDGQYYIKATLVQGNGFDNGTQLASAQSGTFTINGSGTCTTNCATPTLSGTPTSGRAPLTVSFTASGLTSSYNYYIDFGDGSSSQVQSFVTYVNTSHTYTAKGTYTAKLYQNNCPQNAQCLVGPTVVSSVTVTVDGTGANTVTAWPSSGYAPLTVTFTMNNNTMSDYFAVDFGDGTSATMQKGSVTHTYYGRGTFTATFSTDYSCLHGQGGAACKIATRFIDDVSVTVY